MCIRDSLWDEDALDRAEQDTTGLVILDDCHVTADRPVLQTRLTAFLRSIKEGDHVVPVSYTHLDVYKRQVHRSSASFSDRLRRGGCRVRNA